MISPSKIIFALLLSAVPFVIGCSLSRELEKMDTTQDFEAYAKKWAPTEDAFVAVQRAAKPYLDKKDWAGAAAVFTRFKPKFPGMEDRFDKIIAIINRPEEKLEIKNLGSGINSKFNEIKPAVTVGGDRLYFASDDRPDGKGNLDIYVSKYENGAWQTAKNIGDKINTREHETINGISFDGNMILIYGGFQGHMGNGDNYYFEKTDKGWSTIRNFGPPVNSNSWDSDGFLTADGKAFIFTSDREGGIGPRMTRSKLAEKNEMYHGSYAGNSDLWISFKRGNVWMPPINLGPKINTPYCERSPYLHPDGRTLYFSSDGHPGLGKLDVFRTVRLREESWTEWSEPENLGKEINTSDDDWGYKVSTNGKTAFFAAQGRQGGYGQNDIYEQTLPHGATPADEVAVLTGKIVDANGKPIPNATIRWGNVSDSNSLESGQLRPDPETGEYKIPLPMGKVWDVYVTGEGMYPGSTLLDLRNKDGNGNNGLNGKSLSGNAYASADGLPGNPNDPFGGRGKDGQSDGGSSANGLNGNRNDGSDGTRGNPGDGRDGNKNGTHDGDWAGKDGADGNSGDPNARNGNSSDINGKNGQNGNAADANGKNGNSSDINGKNGANGGTNDSSGRNGKNGADGNPNDRNGSSRNGNGGDRGNGGDGNQSGRNPNGTSGSNETVFDNALKATMGPDGLRYFTFNPQMKTVDEMRVKDDRGRAPEQRVNNVFFDFDKYDLKPESNRELDRLVLFLQTNPSLTIQIGAHTDDIGSDEYNMTLSLKRAKAVVDYLTVHGIQLGRLDAKGYGKSRPVVPNTSDENRGLNRRVEFHLVE